MLISFVICDLLENNIPQSLIWRVVRRWKKEPTFEEFGMVDGFYFPPRLIQLASFQEMERALQNNELTKNVTTQDKQIFRQSSQSIVRQLKPAKISKSLLKSQLPKLVIKESVPATSVSEIVPLISEQIPEKPLTPPRINSVSRTAPTDLKNNEQIADKPLTPPMIRHR